MQLWLFYRFPMSLTTESRSGFNATAATGDQLRAWRDQRTGCRSRAQAYRAYRSARIVRSSPAMVDVVPVHEAGRPGTRALQIIEAPSAGTRPVFGSAEQRRDVSAIVADSGPRVRGTDVQPVQHRQDEGGLEGGAGSPCSTGFSPRAAMPSASAVRHLVCCELPRASSGCARACVVPCRQSLSSCGYTPRRSSPPRPSPPWSAPHQTGPPLSRPPRERTWTAHRYGPQEEGLVVTRQIIDLST